MAKQPTKDAVDIRKMIALEEELTSLKETHQIADKPKWWMTIGDRIIYRKRREPVAVNRRTYIKFALLLGVFGGHRFYSRQPVLGGLYLLLCWTGLSVGMTFVDLMIALPMKADEHGLIRL
ncbi:MAG: TM2 domain-containing protein [Eubacteriales bacterium]|nr:TM2 domain-containing protein [Eubacteriales bacterium]